MFKQIATIAVLTATALTAAPALAAQPANTTDLVYKVQSEAAWQGVEVSHIKRDGERLVAIGTDRQDRDVRINMTCQQLALTCRTDTMMASSKVETPAVVSGVSGSSGQ